MPMRCFRKANDLFSPVARAILLAIAARVLYESSPIPPRFSTAKQIVITKKLETEKVVTK